MRPWLEPQSWELVANRLAGYRLRGFGELLTTETLRLSTALELAAGGVAPGRIRMDQTPSSERGAGLVIDSPFEAVIGLSYPHEAASYDASWTTPIDEVTTEFVRLASYVAVADRLVVLVVTNRLRRHLTAASARSGSGLDLNADTLHLRSAATTVAPHASDLDDVGPAYDITAHQLVRARVDAELEILIYLVEPARVSAPSLSWQAMPDAIAMTIEAPTPQGPSPTPSRPVAPAPVSQSPLPPVARSPTPSLPARASRTTPSLMPTLASSSASNPSPPPSTPPPQPPTLSPPPSTPTLWPPTSTPTFSPPPPEVTPATSTPTISLPLPLTSPERPSLAPAAPTPAPAPSQTPAPAPAPPPAPAPVEASRPSPAWEASASTASQPSPAAATALHSPRHHSGPAPAERRHPHSLLALPATMKDLDTTPIRTSPTIWSQLTDCVTQLEQPFTRSEIVQWFRHHHPGTLEVTLSSHIQSATSHPGRPTSQVSRTPLITRIDRNLYVRYEG